MTKGVLEASKLVSTKTLLLKHHYAIKDEGQTEQHHYAWNYVIFVLMLVVVVAAAMFLAYPSLFLGRGSSSIFCAATRFAAVHSAGFAVKAGWPVHGASPLQGVSAWASECGRWCAGSVVAVAKSLAWRTGSPLTHLPARSLTEHTKKCFTSKLSL